MHDGFEARPSNKEGSPAPGSFVMHRESRGNPVKEGGPAGRDPASRDNDTDAIVYCSQCAHVVVAAVSPMCTRGEHQRRTPLMLLGSAEVNGCQDRVPDKKLYPAASVGRERCTKES